MVVAKANVEDQKKTPHQRTPSSKPPFTVQQIKKAIPPHCFRRSLLRSLVYLVYDLTIAFFFYQSTSYFQFLPYPLNYIAWPIYWLFQGCILTAVWVVAHECGHHAFSDYQWIDNFLGFILHSALFVPYFSWKYSHRRHHSNTCSLDNDEAFIPKPKSEIQWYLKYLNNPPGRFITLVATLTLGWPLYLAFNFSGQPHDRFTSHFNPYSPIFTKSERFQVYLSDAGILGVTYVLYQIALAKGLTWLLCVYGVPLLVVNGFLILITYLNHTHISVPHYDSSEWDWLRGALSTVDRDYGVLNKVFHNITNTHVAHHLFSTISHYHAMEATKAIRPLLGDYYHYDDTPFLKALWREAKECLYVEPNDQETNTTGIHWYRNKL
ncbi:hypothetical protein L6164_005722 [Bauhinia variegata]|uniref:Uncharacterized protein n=1 Tax=Bauhinia variegata TaxID=167791 RepID=A0ACB9PS41_BAUVA|nr:hypothetical protein L6164_005722 [Bauhinia variegata]